MSSLFSYMTDMEYECAVEHQKFMLECTKFDNAFRLARMNHQVRINDIDTKVFVENADDSTLEYLYSDEMQVYTESVKELWDKFVKWVKGIVAAIFKKTDEIKNMKIDKDSEEKYESNINIDKACDIGERIISELNAMKMVISDKADDVSSNINNLNNKIDDASEKISSDMKKLDKDVKKNNIETIERKKIARKIVGTVGGLGIAAFSAKALADFSKCEVKTVYSLPDAIRKNVKLRGVSEKLADAVEKFVNKLKDANDPDDMTVGEKIFSKILKTIESAVNSIRAKAKDAINDAVEDAAETIATKTGEAVDGAIQKSKEAVKDAKDQVVQTAKNSVQTATDNAKKKTEEIVTAAVDETGEIIKDTKKKAEETANKIKDTASTAKDAVATAASDLKDSIVGDGKKSDKRVKIKIPSASEWDSMKPQDRANTLADIFEKKKVEIKRESIIKLAKLSHEDLIDKYKNKSVYFESENIWDHVMKNSSSELSLDDLMIESSVNDYIELMELANLL